jgi:gamma-glutamyltranspeptidase/glutathione hydrolase
VSPVVGTAWAKGAAVLKDQPGFAETFMPDGRAPKPGERFRNPGAARTLRAIAETKGRAFYEGEIAQEIAAFAKANGGAMTVDDLAAHYNDWCGTISQSFDDVELHEIPPNGQGIAALMALGILQHTDIRDHGPDDLAAVHLQIEAVKLAYADLHAYVADRDHMTDVDESALLDPAYLESRAALIDANHAQNFGTGAPKQGGTVLLNVGWAALSSRTMRASALVWLCRARAYRCRTGALASQRKKAIKIRSRRANAPSTRLFRALR